MVSSRHAATLLLAAIGLGFGFLMANQLRAQLVPLASNKVARYQALVATVRRLEGDSAADVRHIAALRSQVDSLEAAAARRSASLQSLRRQVQDLRLHAGLTSLTGPGVTVTLAAGPRLPGEASQLYGVGYQDVEDVVNLLFSSGAEGVAVNGHRFTPTSVLGGSGAQVLIDQETPLNPPFQVAAVGDRLQMAAALADGGSLPDVRFRQREYGLQLSWLGSPSLTLPGYAASLMVRYASAA
ncbi:MAG: DUF881 domain-containing protein [Candidatus Dormibacterales bacterium]